MTSREKTLLCYSREAPSVASYWLSRYGCQQLPRFFPRRNWTGTACPFAIQNLIKTEISKMTALRDALVDASENWSTYYFCFLLFIGVFYVCVWSNFSRAPRGVATIYARTHGPTLEILIKKIFIGKRRFLIIKLADLNHCATCSPLLVKVNIFNSLSVGNNPDGWQRFTTCWFMENVPWKTQEMVFPSP